MEIRNCSCLVSYVVYHKQTWGILHQTNFTIICLQINRKQGSVPVICNKTQISIPTADTTWNMQGNLKQLRQSSSGSSMTCVI
ncbi:hypothetical protein C4D60_Mb01t27220 [Musa balbisiana]|uniref:Uncharacterized protein n=1 Tax=Musa balbisiana TaxID=52838 RepID=A0A4S8JR30_MUSBA|nr:hypothetical protein C4D60_Mb01t27220 [Musa balbisiana]